MGKNIKTTFSNLWENSYDILVTLDVNELSDKFNEECYLRRQFNSTCINIVKEASVNLNEEHLPDCYSGESVVLSSLLNAIEVHRRHRIGILKLASFILRPILFILDKNNRYIKIEKRVFVLFSHFQITSYLIKSFIVNIFSSIIVYKLNKQKLDLTQTLICIGFPWYSFINNLDDNITDKNKYEAYSYSSLASYICSQDGFKSSSTFVSVDEYSSDTWDSSSNLHTDRMLPRAIVSKKIASPLSFIRQLVCQVDNIKYAYSVVSKIRRHMVLSIAIVNYFTSSVSKQVLLKKLDNHSNRLSLIISGASLFYTFPWYANEIKNKYFYMYSANSCYSPFFFYSGLDKSNQLDRLVKNNNLLLGFLEWPLYFRRFFERDLGYQGVVRLSLLLQKKQDTTLNASLNRKEKPLQLGGVVNFHNTRYANLPANQLEDRSLLFLDEPSRSRDIQLSLFEVPSSFNSHDAAGIYYKCLFEIAEMFNIRIYIRTKYRNAEDIYPLISQYLEDDICIEDRVVILPPQALLKDQVLSVLPLIVLAKPMSSSYFYVKKLGYPVYYFIPSDLESIFINTALNFGESSFKPDSKWWFTEKDVTSLLTGDLQNKVNVDLVRNF